ncbi:response regulator transcription factor [Clostridium pasteurianum]|uniref:Stage 0 sporulation protein A homolog n=1 Tax=Clostridium pasteurianum BC1 TaxID=86416 RepID=R4K041_CLOPA|nr:response regulator [Clostridium pasteurianum]AGK95938.1 response regulator containing CheY-like receiver domain and AraC-type DNA-binding domain [Clostridium pasteurianum BC1]
MYKILLVDDEELQREALKIMLKNFKDAIEVIGEAQNGREAIELDEKLDPDIIFMDVRIPGIDGIKASEIIKNRNHNKIIIMITAYDDFNLIHKALLLNVNDYILKPVRDAQLNEVLNTQITTLKLHENKRKKAELKLADKDGYGEKNKLCSMEKDEADKENRNCINKALQPALKYIEENYRDEISLEKMANVTNLSMYYFSRLFKKEIGINFTTYVNQCKIKKAKEMLKYTDIPIVDIAAELGYYECGYFTKIFKKINGITPTNYRNIIKK